MYSLCNTNNNNMYTFEERSLWTQVLKTIYVQVIFTHIWTCSHVVSAIMAQYDVHLIIIYKQFFCVRIRCHVPSKYKPDQQQYNFLSKFYSIINIVIVLIRKRESRVLWSGIVITSRPTLLDYQRSLQNTDWISQSLVHITKVLRGNFPHLFQPLFGIWGKNLNIWSIFKEESAEHCFQNLLLVK